LLHFYNTIAVAVLSLLPLWSQPVALLFSPSSIDCHHFCKLPVTIAAFVAATGSLLSHFVAAAFVTAGLLVLLLIFLFRQCGSYAKNVTAPMP